MAFWDMCLIIVPTVKPWKAWQRSCESSNSLPSDVRMYSFDGWEKQKESTVTRLSINDTPTDIEWEHGAWVHGSTGGCQQNAVTSRRPEQPCPTAAVHQVEAEWAGGLELPGWLPRSLSLTLWCGTTVASAN